LDDDYFQTLKKLMVLVKELGNQLDFMGLVIWKISKLGGLWLHIRVIPTVLQLGGGRTVSFSIIGH
jgi:hypothetical protein